MTTTAALLAGRTENTPLNCPPTVTVDGNVFKNAMNESFGQINLSRPLPSVATPRSSTCASR